MLVHRPAADRGVTNLGWLHSRHTFSFGPYQDPNHMGFQTLRVLNEERFAPGRGFGKHPHRDVEIVSYVLEGTIRHRDSLGHESTLRPGDVQRMTAGTGVVHSEMNPSETDSLHFLQIWIVPGEPGLPPGYEQRRIPVDARPGELVLLGSPTGADGSVRIHQDVVLYGAKLDAGHLDHPLPAGRHAWIQMIEGAATVNGTKLEPGDGAALTDEGAVRVAAQGTAHFLLFDLA